MEIERKFLVQSLPEGLENCRVLHMRQAYISTSPVIRVREVLSDGKEEYVLTVKGPGMIMREEHELFMSRSRFEALLLKRDGRVIEKDRYLVPLADGHTAEMDVFHGDLAGLRTVEVEFQDAEDMKRFTPPAWFGADVSLDYRYRNSYLSMAEEEEGNQG